MAYVMSKTLNTCDKKQTIALVGLEQHMGGVLSDIETSQYVIHSVPLNNVERLSEFDSVIIFQGAFERFDASTSVLGRSKWITCNKDELDRRTKEIVQLMQKGGFVLVLLTRPFYDVYGDEKYVDTDIAKRFSNLEGVSRYDLPSSNPYVSPLKGELESFCAKHCRAYSYFNCNRGASDDLDYVPLIKTSNDKVVGISFLKNLYYIPALLPKNGEWVEFITEATTPIFNIHKKRRAELPEWVNEVRLGSEDLLRKELAQSEERINEIKERLVVLSGFKRVLIETGDDLVRSVASLIREVTNLMVDARDEKKEDCRLCDASGEVRALIEIKGINGNVKMSNVSQTFEHRERTPGCENLPTLLIANTFIGTARSEDEKDKAPEEEQIELANRHGVLILRTLDLLRIYNSVLHGKVEKDTITKLLLTKTGWIDWKNVVDAN